MVALIKMPKGAQQYLSASGAVAVSSVNHVAIDTQWLPQKSLRKVMQTACELAGDHPDIQQASAALHQAAAQYGVVLTPDRIAVERARQANMALNEWMQRGLSQSFNAVYARRRRLGQTKLSYPVARARFRRLLIKRLGKGLSSNGLIDEVFGD